MSDGVAWSEQRLPGLGPASVVLVAGGGGAIGGRVAEAVVALGGQVILVGRSEPALAMVAARCADPSAVHVVAGDIARRDDCVEVVRRAEAHAGPLTGVVNAAAVSDGGLALADLREPQLERVLGANLVGPIFLSQAAFASMERAGGGSLVHVGSVEAYRAQTGKLLYGVSKAALLRLVGQLAIEGGPLGIRVNAVSAGQTPTPLVAFDAPPGSSASATAGVSSRGVGAEAIPLRRRGRLDDYVGSILFLLSDLAAYVTGQDLATEGGILWQRLQPRPTTGAPDGAV